MVDRFGARVFRLREFAHELCSRPAVDQRLFDTCDSLGWLPEETVFVLLQAGFVPGQFPARDMVVLENFPSSLTQLLLLTAIAGRCAGRRKHGGTARSALAPDHPRGGATAGAVRTHQPVVAARRAHHCGREVMSWVNVIQEPLSEYLRYELIGCVESMAVGEEIRLASPPEGRALADF